MTSRVMSSPDQETVHQLARQLADATPQEVLSWAMDTFGDSFAVASSGTDAVLVDMASRIRDGVHVVFVDTGHHFAETLWMRDQMVERYGAHVVTSSAEQSLADQEADHGVSLFLRQPDLCCWLRKVEPFNATLSGYAAWASGIRRDEGSTRSRTEVVEWDHGRGMVKVNPLAYWTQHQVDDYIERHDVLVNPLQEAGYPSIGCAPCTSPAVAGDDPRSGRWIGLNKTECGLHV